MKWKAVIALALLAVPARAELTRDKSFDVLVDVALYESRCHGYLSPSTKAAMDRLGDLSQISVSDEIDVMTVIGRMVKRSFELNHPAALADFCDRMKVLVEALDRLERQLK